jgi:hypothetical protein
MMSPTLGGIMALKMTHAMRMELADAIRGRYAAAPNKDKRRILEEFIAATGYHEKSAIRVLNTSPEPKRRQTRRRPSLYDEAARGALIVLWEASDRVCGKRLRALLPILLPALERNGHLKLEVEIRCKILSMSAATIDRLLQVPRRTTLTKKAPRVMPEPRRRIKMRTFADWKEPPPGNMEMDLVAHCGEINRGSYIHSLVLTDIATGWTEAAPIVVREGSLVVETLERIRVGLPFVLTSLDVDNGSEFVNNRLIDYCLGHGIELTRSRPYRKNDQAWIEQKNGAVVRKLLGYRRFEGLGAARAITRLYGASRLFVNFFQPSFKLAAKQRDGAKVTKRYYPPQTPCASAPRGEHTDRQQEYAARDRRGSRPAETVGGDASCPGLFGSTGERRNTATDNSRSARPGGVRSRLIERLARGRDPADVLDRSQAAVSAESTKSAETNGQSHVGAPTGDSATSRRTVRKNAGEADAGLRRTWSSPYPGAPHGLADRMPPFRGIPQHERHAALRGAVRPISRAIYPQTVQDARSPSWSLASERSRAGRRNWTQNISPAQRETAWSTSRHI